MGNTKHLESSNYIAQAHKGELGYWKYLIPSVLFFGLMIISVLTALILDIDQAKIIKEQIAQVGANMTFVNSILPLSIFCLLLLLYVKYVHKQSILSLTTTRPKIDWSRVAFSFGVVTLFISGITAIDYLLNPDSYVLNFEASKFFILLILAIILIPLQTSFEEYMFRGYLMQGIGSYFKSRLLALLLTSILFGLLHIANPEVGKVGYIILISYVGTGFLFGIMTLMDEGLELALGYHAANNLVTVLLLTADWTAFQTNSILRYVGQPNSTIDVFIPVFVFYPLILFIFSKRYGWNNWKEKLTGKLK